MTFAGTAAVDGMMRGPARQDVRTMLAIAIVPEVDNVAHFVNLSMNLDIWYAVVVTDTFRFQVKPAAASTVRSYCHGSKTPQIRSSGSHLTPIGAPAAVMKSTGRLGGGNATRCWGTKISMGLRELHKCNRRNLGQEFEHLGSKDRHCHAGITYLQPCLRQHYEADRSHR